MDRDPRMYLWEVREAADHVASFVSGHSLEEYRADVMLRSAVERQLEIIGEAVSQLSRLDPSLAERLPDVPRVVGFRNRLIHGYMDIDHALVLSVAREQLPVLRDTVEAMLDELADDTA